MATLTVTEARINASLGNDIIVQGSLGGLQILDLTPQGSKHQRVVSVGHDPLVEQHQSLYMLVSQGLYGSCNDPASSYQQHRSNAAGRYQHHNQQDLAGLSAKSFSVANETKAFSFQFLQRNNPRGGSDPSGGDPADSELILDVKMASLCYTHSAHFLVQVAACVSEFQQSVSNLAGSLRSSAAELAKDLMHRGTQGLAQTIYVGGHFASSVNESLSRIDLVEPPEYRQGSSAVFQQVGSPRRVRFNAVLQSPILVLPRSAHSAQVLVAHLGQIELSNDPVRSEATDPARQDRVRDEDHFDMYVNDMSLYSLDVDEKWKNCFSLQCDPTPGSPSQQDRNAQFLRVTAQELYSCASHGKPILHDTRLKFSLDRLMAGSVLGDPFVNGFDQDPVFKLVKINGSVVSPLQMSLSRSQYQQIIDSINNLQDRAGSATPAYSSRPNPSTNDLDGCSDKDRPELVVQVEFQLPNFSMHLLDNQDRAIVNLSFQDLMVRYDKSCAVTAAVEMSLKSLILQDLMMAEDSKYRRLVASNSRKSGTNSSQGSRLLPSFLSTSCPDLRRIGSASALSTSLPARLVDPVRSDPYRNKRSCVTILGDDCGGPAACPGTPPSSPLPLKDPDDNLIR